jgi:hypothetical protein
MSDKRGSIAKVTYFPEACIGSKAMIKKIADSHPNVFIENKQI